MTDKTKKPDLKIVNKDTDLTIKQRAFVDEIIKGKLGSYKEAYAKVYDVTLTKQGKIPKWVEVEASKLVARLYRGKKTLQLLHPYEQGITFLKGSCQRVKKRIVMQQGSGH